MTKEVLFGFLKNGNPPMALPCLKGLSYRPIFVLFFTSWISKAGIARPVFSHLQQPIPRHWTHLSSLISIILPDLRSKNFIGLIITYPSYPSYGRKLVTA